MGQRYLLDNNVLSKLTRDQRASEFVQSRCRIPAEVLFEARFFPDADDLNGLEYPTSARVLSYLKMVMETVPVSDTSLVDLYNNRGNADPLLIACALDAIEEASDGLFGWEWVIVSDDNAVAGKAVEFKIARLTGDQFASLL